SSRTATHKCARFSLTPDASIRPGSCRFCIMTARRSPRISSLAISDGACRSLAAPRSEWWPHDLYYEAQNASSEALAEFARLHASRLRGKSIDAMRGLRPRFDKRGADSCVLRTQHRTAPCRQAL